MISPVLNPFLNRNDMNSSCEMFAAAYHSPCPHGPPQDAEDCHHASKLPSCSMLPETTATTGWDVPSIRPMPGYRRNLIRTKARMTFTIQLQMELSSQMKCHTLD